MKRMIIAAVLLALLCSFASAFADTAKTEKEYRAENAPELPETLNMGTTLDCGDYSIRLMSVPSGTNSIVSINTANSMKYLVLRVGITNHTDHVVSWLDAKSFFVQEYFLDEFHGTYALNHYMSAKAAQSYGLAAYFTAIQPGAELSTVLVFDVYPGADGWVMTFAPFTRSEASAKEEIRFALPKTTL